MNDNYKYLRLHKWLGSRVIMSSNDHVIISIYKHLTLHNFFDEINHQRFEFAPSIRYRTENCINGPSIDKKNSIFSSAHAL